MSNFWTMVAAVITAKVLWLLVDGFVTALKNEYIARKALARLRESFVKDGW